MGLIWFLSSQSVLPKPKGIFGFDKAQHLLAYAVLAGAAALWTSRKIWKRRAFTVLLCTALAVSAYGAVDEIHQYFVPGRDCNFWDWLADILGAFLGAGAALIIARGVKSRAGRVRFGPFQARNRGGSGKGRVN
ncbi:MAG: VanZ family protein [Treponema sp.]|jgi:VanZ family protein|nr:VanZ family protein [Treponema sp.]